MKEKYLKQQAQRLTAGHIDRRQFIMSALAAGVVLPSAMSMAGNAMAQTPKKGGKLRQGMGYGSTTDSLDPGTYENSYIQSVGYAYGNNLTEVNNDGSQIPELAPRRIRKS